MHCHHQATAAARVRGLTTAQFAWLASSAPARSAGTQGHSRCACSSGLTRSSAGSVPTWPVLIRHRLYAHLACSALGVGPESSDTSWHWLAVFCPAPTPITYGSYSPLGFGPLSMALAPCRDLVSLRFSGHKRAFSTSELAQRCYSACATPPL